VITRVWVCDFLFLAWSDLSSLNSVNIVVQPGKSNMQKPLVLLR
jgi:hypothetical protein